MTMSPRRREGDPRARATAAGTFGKSLLALCLLAGAAVAAESPDADDGIATGRSIIGRTLEAHRGDLPAMVERRSIRVLTAFSRTNFFVADGQPRGFEHDNLAGFDAFLAHWLARELPAEAAQHPHVTLAFITLPFAELIPALLEGKGDLIAANMIVSPTREKLVTFSDAYLEDVSDVLVTGVRAGPFHSVDDLAGRTVHVQRARGHEERLHHVNTTLAARGLAPIRVIEMPPALNSEDLLEMVNAGVIEATFVHDHVADLWAHVFPDIRVHAEVALADRARIAWATRPDSPLLRRALDDFLRHRARRHEGKADALFVEYYGNPALEWLRNPLGPDDRDRLAELAPHFRENGQRRDFEWRLLAAVAFQESGLNQAVVSNRGAVGIMQLLPSTARELGYADISSVEHNIAAGTAYLDHLRRSHFVDPAITRPDQIYFTLAAYNCGPARVQELRRLAKENGLDPNRWFGQVEQEALRVVGEETVRYVANIHRYFIAYEFEAELIERRHRESRR
ncbi:MAG: transporter substrate-binding domain-containing protein [Alphaproteobacteria bacterium]